MSEPIRQTTARQGEATAARLQTLDPREGVLFRSPPPRSLGTAPCSTPCARLTLCFVCFVLGGGVHTSITKSNSRRSVCSVLSKEKRRGGERTETLPPSTHTLAAIPTSKPARARGYPIPPLLPTSYGGRELPPPDNRAGGDGGVGAGVPCCAVGLDGRVPPSAFPPQQWRYAKCYNLQC